MGTGFTVAGADLDDIFAPYTGGSKPALTGFVVSGQDLRDRYNPRSQGGDIGFDTGFVVSGQDLRALFAAKTSSRVNSGASYVLTATTTGPAGTQHTVSDGITFEADGTSTGAVNWLIGTGAGMGANYQIRVDISDKYTQPGATFTVSNELSNWTTMTAAKNVSAVLTASPATTVSNFAMRVRIRRADTHAVVYDKTTSPTQNRFWVTLA